MFKTDNDILRKTSSEQFEELKNLRAEKEDNLATIEYDKGRIKTLIHENDLSKRRNKELEERMAIIQEKVNEYLSNIYANEIEIEKFKLIIDKRNTEQEKFIKERDYFKIDHEAIAHNISSLEQQIVKMQQEHEDFKLQITEKEKELLTKEAIQKTYEERFEELIAKVKDLEYKIDNLERVKITLEEKNKIYFEENEGLKQAQEKFANSVKKMNDERNHFKDTLDSANLRIASLNDHAHHNDEIIGRLTRELDKVKTNLSKAERYSDALEIKKEASERTANMQKRQLCEQIKTISEQWTAEKDAREKWIERYESEYKAHFETTAELLKIRTEFKTLEHRANDLELELGNLK